VPASTAANWYALTKRGKHERYPNKVSSQPSVKVKRLKAIPEWWESLRQDLTNRSNARIRGKKE
jgi:hypothetical protein